MSFFIDHERYDVVDALCAAWLLAFMVLAYRSGGFVVVAELVAILGAAALLGQKRALVRMRKIRERMERKP